MTQFALRLDSDLHQDLKNVSNVAGLSMNQLIHGICEAAISNVHVGEPAQADGLISIEKRAGCVFFGDVEEGTIWFGLDFSGRGYRKYD